MRNLKWYTDITEFHLNGEKLYLSPILDGCGGDIVSYTISKHPDRELVMTMLDRAFAKETALNNCIFHTDQGCQYQSPRYQRALKLHGITQMPRKRLLIIASFILIRAVNTKVQDISVL